MLRIDSHLLVYATLNPCHNLAVKFESRQAYSYNIEQKLCFLKGDSVGQRNNTAYVSGYLPQFEDLESEQYCAVAGNQDLLRTTTCDVAPPCGNKECEFGFKRNEKNCQDSCDCYEDDERFIMDDIIITEEIKPYVLKKLQVISLTPYM